MIVRVVRSPEEHGTGKDSPKCTCRGLVGEVLRVWDNGVADVRFGKSKGRAGVPFKDLREVEPA